MNLTNNSVIGISFTFDVWRAAKWTGFPLQMSLTKDGVRLCLNVTVWFEWGLNKYEAKATIDELTLFRNEVDSILVTCFDKCWDQLLREFFSHYDYPAVRFWAFEKFDDHTKKELVQENTKIPGWIFPKWNQAHVGLKAKKYANLLDESGIEEKDDVAKKVRVVKGVQKDLSSVKKPFCKVHPSTEMKFNIVRNVFECPETGCGLIARPKNDSDQITFGTGNVQLRVLMDNGDPKYILIADNNVALDVTQYVLKSVFDFENEISDRQQANNGAAKRTSFPSLDLPMRLRGDIFDLNDYPL